MGNLYDKGLDFKCGALSLDSQMVNIHYHLNYRQCVRILQTMHVIINFDFSNQFKGSFNQLKWVIFMIRD